MPRYRNEPDESPDAQQRKRKALYIGLGVGAGVLVIALVVLATVLSQIFSDVGGPLQGDELGLNAPTSTTENADSDVVKPVSATVFSPGGEADNPADAALAIDGNPATAWPTDTYSDPAPFPGFKNGVGLLLQLPKPTTLASVSLDLNSTGTSVQLRAAQSSTPASLEDTTELTSPQTMKTGANTITVSDATPTQYVLVWITTLGTVDGKSETAISDITLKANS